MNKTAIPWADYTWNPIVGCRNGCEYCYARRLATTRLAHLCPKCATFEPHLHPERFQDPRWMRKPAVIFADSMGDPWSDGVDQEMRDKMYWGMYVAPSPRFVVLTKRPERITDEDCFVWNQRLSHVWLGVSITSGADWWRWEALAKLPGHIHKFISVEPLLGDGVDDCLLHSDRLPEWIIVGPQSGKGAAVVSQDWQGWIRMAVGFLRIPLFEKAGLPIQPAIRQMPPELALVFQKGVMA